MSGTPGAPFVLMETEDDYCPQISKSGMHSFPVQPSTECPGRRSPGRESQVNAPFLSSCSDITKIYFGTVFRCFSQRLLLAQCWSDLLQIQNQQGPRRGARGVAKEEGQQKRLFAGNWREERRWEEGSGPRHTVWQRLKAGWQPAVGRTWRFSW